VVPQGADQGYAFAQYSLGAMYANGRGSLRTISRQSLGIARPPNKDCRTLDTASVLHTRTVEGFRKTFTLAVALFCKAAEQGHKEAKNKTR